MADNENEQARDEQREQKHKTDASNDERDSAAGDDSFTAEEEAEIQKRLEDLGYI
jgi:hypothetical protein